MDNPQSPRRLYRSSTDRIIAGVCGGLAEYTYIDSTIIRIIFILLAFMGGSGLFLYIILILIVPPEGEMPHINHAEKMKEFVEKASDTVRSAAQDFKSQVSYNWPQIYAERRRRRTVFFGTVILALGLLILLRQVFPYHWVWFRGDIIWPTILIVVGIYFLIRSR